MFEEDCKSLLITKINLSDDSKELMKIYNENTSFSFEILHKLLSLKNFSEFLSIWNLSYSNLKKNPIELKKLIFTSKEIRDISESKIADEFLTSLLEIAVDYNVSYESFKICLLASEIIQLKKQFPSKSWIITYFTLVSKFFQSNDLFASYINVLYILKEYQPVSISKLEFDFYSKVILLKAEVPYKDLFCGIKTRDINSMIFEYTDSEFVFEPIWNDIFNLKVKLTIENVSFIMSKGLIFHVVDDLILINSGSHVKFVSKIFEIANSFKPIINSQVVNEQHAVKSVAKPELKMPVATAAHPHEQVFKKKEFKNRYTNLYKKFKLIHKYSTIAFKDTCFDERKNLRNEKFNEQKLAIEKEKERLSIYNNIIPELKAELRIKVEAKLAEDKLNEQERIKVEEERQLEERKSRMWRSQIPTNPTTENAPVYKLSSNTNLSQPQFVENKSIYRPNISAIQSMIETSSIADSASPKAQGPWRSRDVKNYNQELSNIEDNTSKAQGSWKSRDTKVYDQESSMTEDKSGKIQGSWKSRDTKVYDQESSKTEDKPAKIQGPWRSRDTKNNNQDASK